MQTQDVSGDYDEPKPLDFDVFRPTPDMAKKKKYWIKDAIKHPGALRKQLGSKKGKNIPRKKLRATAKKKGTIGRRARLALTLSKFARKKRKK